MLSSTSDVVDIVADHPLGDDITQANLQSLRRSSGLCSDSMFVSGQSNELVAKCSLSRRCDLLDDMLYV